MKKIIIKGSNNIKSFTNEKTRDISLKWKNKSFLLGKSNQVEILNKIFLNETFDGKEEVLKEIKKKRSGYRNQDVKKNRMDDTLFIKFDEIIEKLVVSKLKCYYCKCSMLLCYEEKREKTQWSLDRINNNIGHFTNNVVCSCLECNLKKRTRDAEKFRFTKQMKIKKIL
jgi:hypothetical protein|uniref:HNH endonuclease n=1 Tax=viral metagenome TaxID=1070528 RepID=A0A6C0AKS8_9ZZZZ